MLVANILVFSDFCTNLIFLIISFGLTNVASHGAEKSGLCIEGAGGPSPLGSVSLPQANGPS